MVVLALIGFEVCGLKMGLYTISTENVEFDVASVCFRIADLLNDSKEVPPARLELAHLAAVDFESTVSTIPPGRHYLLRCLAPLRETEILRN